MKKVARTGFVILSGLFFISFFTSCEKIKSLADVKFDTELGGDIHVMISKDMQKSATVDTYPFSESVKVDLRDNEDIDKYFDKLKNFDVQSVTLTVKGVTGGPVTLLNGSLTIGAASSSALWLVKNVALESGNTITLDNNTGQWDIVNEILDSKKNFTIAVEGTTDKDNVSFTLYVGIKVSVTANPL